MRRSFEELKPLWDVLSMQTFPGGDFSDEKAAIIAKWSNIVMERLYPAYSSDYTYVLNEYGEISNGEYSVSECADMGIYSHMAWSETAAMCSYYLEKSPHWNYYIRVIEAGVVEPDEEEEGFEKMAKMVAFHGKYMEDLILTESGEEFLLKLYEFFEDAEYEDCGCGDEYYVLTTSLYFYAKKLMDMAKEEYPEEVAYLRTAFSVLKGYFSGEELEAEVGDVSYFLCTDGSGGDHPSCDMGCFCFEETAFIAAEMAESIIFELDSIYNVLPEYIRALDGGWRNAEF